jgi:hypothetical protein
MDWVMARGLQEALMGLTLGSLGCVGLELFFD